MRLQRIYSSKLYLTSSRKSQISDEINSPFNKELVTQLAEYLDEDALLELEQTETKLKEQQKNSKSKDNSEVSAPEDSFTPSSGGGSSHSFSGNVFDDFGEDDLGEGGDDFSEETADIPDMPDIPAESETNDLAASKHIKGKSITATSTIWTTIEDVASECQTIQGTLNAREDTKGVTRLQVKDSELWIYFNDDANLNDKMVDVIEVLNSTGYTYLAFNRLARSNNAIVFDIALNTQEPIKSDKDIEENI